MDGSTTTHPAERRHGVGRVALLVVSALLALVGFATTVGGSVLVWAHATQRDDAGFYASSTHRLTTSTYALTSDLDLGQAPGERGWTITHPVGTLRIVARSVGEAPVFVGIGRQTDVEQWLTGVAHERLTGVNLAPFRTTSTVAAGTAAPTPPAARSFWVASASGTGTQTVLWPAESGRWTAVLMPATGQPGVSADVSVGAKTGALLPIGIGLIAFGLLAATGGALLLFAALRHDVTPAALAGRSGAVPGTYPARLDGHLDSDLSRWRWLVKWVLLIPHVVVLAFLWLAVTVLTVVAGVAILFAGRYPRSIFDFNVGVMRWSWRVGFYGANALATDRYPPFSLRSDPTYPADFNVDYPEHLSRGLVLVKWWLLALPHLLIVGILSGGWGFGATGSWRIIGSGGLIALLTLVAGVTVAVRNHYPEGLFDLVMGLNRWCYRVLAYCALMTDEYPPFRLDSGGADPGTVVPPRVSLPPPPPPVTGHLVDATGGSAR